MMSIPVMLLPRFGLHDQGSKFDGVGVTRRWDAKFGSDGFESGNLFCQKSEL